MTPSRIHLANIIIMLAFVPCIFIGDESGSFVPNILGLCYLVCLYLFGRRLAPKVVRDYLDYMDRTRRNSQTGSAA